MLTNPVKLIAHGALCLAAAVLFAACGGGGSDSPALSTPVAAVPAQQAASAPAAAPPATEPQAGAPTLDTFQKEALDAHNKARADEKKGIASLKWSAQLQADAQAWADQCTFDHSTPKGQGQNLYATSEPTASASRAVQSWMGEKADYTYAATGGTCAAGKACGHYKQVIWSTTTDVGCGVKTCERMKLGFPGGTLLVCNYSPPGNFAGQPPYPAP